MLCKFINLLPAFLPLFFDFFSRASTNVLENAIPYAILSEHPDHSNPSLLGPFTVRSQPHLVSFPLEHARVTAWATPAADIACTKDASLVPGGKNSTNQYRALETLKEILVLNFTRFSTTKINVSKLGSYTVHPYLNKINIPTKNNCCIFDVINFLLLLCSFLKYHFKDRESYTRWEYLISNNLFT